MTQDLPVFHRIDQTFRVLREHGHTAFMPFLTAGDPDLNVSRELIKLLEDCGVDMIELGFPYSDPLADGPVIQASFTRALQNKLKMREILDWVSELRKGTALPITAMLSYSLVYRFGVSEFMAQAAASGIDGAIIPDLPVEESKAAASAAAEHNFKLIHLLAPTTHLKRAETIAQQSSGFIYYTSVVGITGERDELPDNLKVNLTQVKRMAGGTPVCVGFGVSKPEHARLLKPMADGVIVGSAIVRRIARLSEGTRKRAVFTDLKKFVTDMLAELKEAPAADNNPAASNGC